MAAKAERASLGNAQPAAPDLGVDDSQQPTMGVAITPTQTHRAERGFGASADQGRVTALLEHRRLSADRATKRCIVGEYRACVMLQVSAIEKPRCRERCQLVQRETAAVRPRMRRKLSAAAMLVPSRTKS